MILRRLSTNLRSQNWVAIGIEFLLVVLGVFFGIVAANWNEERLEKRETAVLLTQLEEELSTFVNYIDSVGRYYESAGGYADRAAAAWEGDRSISDADFVIAAYQASQINGIANNAEVWGAIFGAENLRDIEDPVIRRNLGNVMTFDYALTDLRAVASRYREEVRKTIPNRIQAAIREQCGDRQGPDGPVLPTRCVLGFAAEDWRTTAAALRARPELLAELQWHRAAIANQMAQGRAIQESARILVERIGPRR
ncbi:MAG TPA: hypothetical protein VFO42_05690 [Sphingomicrobium sp.]|nr:hypothetical protein [Sphingomicrobium sp.]